MPIKFQGVKEKSVGTQSPQIRVIESCLCGEVIRNEILMEMSFCFYDSSRSCPTCSGIASTVTMTPPEGK